MEMVWPRGHPHLRSGLQNDKNALIGIGVRVEVMLVELVKVSVLVAEIVSRATKNSHGTMKEARRHIGGVHENRKALHWHSWLSPS
jgi:hypothetical protein